MFRSSLILIAVSVAAALTATEVHSSPKALLLPQVPQTRSLFCSSCLQIVETIDSIVGDDAAAAKKVCDDLCDELFGGPHMASDLAPICKQWLDTDLYIIQLKLKNGWTPSAICQDFHLCSSK